MAAASATGTGTGSADKLDINGLTTLANGPSIIFTGLVETTTDIITSPPTATGTVTFPHTLLFGAEHYVILVTTVNGGYAYVSNRIENDDGVLTGFSVISEGDCTVMYMVATVGTRPNVQNFRL